MSTHYQDQKSFPFANSVKHAIHVLNGGKVKAAIALSDEYKPSINGIEDQEDKKLSEWWTSTQQAKKDFISPGQTTYVANADALEKLQNLGQKPQLLDIASVKNELNKAYLNISDEALHDLHSKMLNVISDFSEIYQKHTSIEREDFVMRAWQIYAPKGALGRTPYLHIDHSVLTGMWYPYEDRAPAQTYTGNVPEQVWAALQPPKAGKTRGKVSKKDHQNSVILQEFTQNAAEKDLMTFPAGALVIAKNLKTKEGNPVFRDLSDPKVRQSILLHKSGNVENMGQVGLIMIPQMIK